MVVPAADNWNVGDQPTSTMLNSRIRDTVDFLKSPPMGVFRKSGTQSVGTGTWTALTWETEDLDSDSAHSTVSNTSRYTAQTAGWFLVISTLAWTGSSSVGMRKVRFRINGDDTKLYGESSLYVDETTAASQDVTSCAYVYLAVSDYVEVQAFQNSGGSVTVTNVENLDSRFEVRWVGILNDGTIRQLPSPKTWSAGLWKTGDANIHIRDSYLFMIDPPMASMIRRLNTQGMSASANAITWEEAEYDTHGGWSAERYTAQIAGWYHSIAQVVIQETTAITSPGTSDESQHILGFTVNQVLPSGFFASSLYIPRMELQSNSFTISVMVYLDVDDWLTLGFGTSIQGQAITPNSRWDVRWISKQ